ncbi:hypothetical protein ROHU_002307 [Labeo rohita]|uniref:Uncharacterized protein n=1 Tax=Labeo rohita TaxID=84645 RepID=A0A498MGD2_LABRO|nr:hypothetical protein ROHU_027491 [Labeo rohita]RXN37146.1 hypothetical protein ROHU_002307 [Labeo rohita]
MLFADSDSEGEYLPFGNGDRPFCPPGMGMAGVNTVVELLEVEAAGVGEIGLAVALALWMQCPKEVGVAAVHVSGLCVGEPGDVVEAAGVI